MKRRAGFREQRSRIFVGCEGQSEQSYSKFVSFLLAKDSVGFHLDSHVLQGGDPLARVRAAILKIDHETLKRGQYIKKFVFLDSDLVETRPDNSKEAMGLASDNSINLIWQKPNHEGFLTMHFIESGRWTPKSNAEISDFLKRLLPNYRKAMASRAYAKTLTIDHVRRAASHEPDFASFIKILRLDQ